MAEQEWQEMPLSDTQSRSTPQNGRWKMTTISAPDKSAQLEFSVSDGLGQVDTPEAGASYRCYVPGDFLCPSSQLGRLPGRICVLGFCKSSPWGNCVCPRF